MGNVCCAQREAGDSQFEKALEKVKEKGPTA